MLETVWEASLIDGDVLIKYKIAKCSPLEEGSVSHGMPRRVK